MRRPRPSHRRRQAPHADGARRRGAEGGSSRSGAARSRIWRLQAAARPGRLPARRPDRRRASTRGSAHDGRGRLHTVGARTQPPRSRSHHLSAFESRAGWPLPPRGQPAGRHGQPPGRPPATYGLTPGRAGRARRPRAQPRASRAASRAALAASHVGGEGQPPWGCHLGQGGPAHLGGWASPISARASPRASPFGGVGQPDWGGGPARSGGRASPIGGVGQPDLGGWLAGWPAG